MFFLTWYITVAISCNRRLAINDIRSDQNGAIVAYNLHSDVYDLATRVFRVYCYISSGVPRVCGQGGKQEK